MRQWREAALRDGWGGQESEEPKEGHHRAEAIRSRLRGLSTRCRQRAARLAGGIDGALRKAAGGGNEIVYRFFQVLLYVVVPILLAILFLIGRVW